MSGAPPRTVTGRMVGLLQARGGRDWQARAMGHVNPALSTFCWPDPGRSSGRDRVGEACGRLASHRIGHSGAYRQPMSKANRSAASW
jgi:hypothetical protein